MKRTGSRLARAALAASLFAATAAAHAVPIVFDFSGTVGSTVGRNFLDDTGWIDDALSGQAFSGRITIETEGLVQSSSSTSSVTTFGYYDAGLDPTILITSELSIGGASYDVGSYTYNTGGFAGQDALTPAPSRDSITVTHRSSENINGVPFTDGLYASLGLRLLWSDLNDPQGLVDLSSFDPLSLIPRLNSLTPTSYYDQHDAVYRRELRRRHRRIDVPHDQLVLGEHTQRSRARHAGAASGRTARHRRGDSAQSAITVQWADEQASRPQISASNDQERAAQAARAR